MTPEQADKIVRLLEEGNRQADARDREWKKVADRLDDRLSQINQTLVEIRELIPEGSNGPGGDA